MRTQESRRQLKKRVRALEQNGALSTAKKAK
jgi:hypothetical protein